MEVERASSPEFDEERSKMETVKAVGTYLSFSYRTVPYPGLRIRSIFGRIRILQIRILKPDPGSGSCFLKKAHFSCPAYFLHGL